MAYKVKTVKGTYRGSKFIIKRKDDVFNRVEGNKFNAYVVDDAEPILIGRSKTVNGGKNAVKRFVDRGEYSI